MNEDMYLLDNNALSHLSRAQRSSAFFRERCRLPSKVLLEAKGYLDAEAFNQVEWPTTAGVLKLLRMVMKTVPEGDTTLLNLYANKGAADPMIVACALDAMRENRGTTLWPEMDHCLERQCGPHEGPRTRSRVMHARGDVVANERPVRRLIAAAKTRQKGTAQRQSPLQ